MEKKKTKATIKARSSEKTVRSKAPSEKKEVESKKIPSLEVHPKIQTAYNWQQKILKAKRTKKA